MKKTFWVLIYFIAFIPFGLSIFYFSENNLLPAFIGFLASFFIFTLLFFKDLKLLSSLSFLTLFLLSLLTLGAAGKQINGMFAADCDEKKFMLALSAVAVFILINSIFWTQTKRGFKKIVSLFTAFLSVLILIVFGITSPAYYQNFIYTRINILILLTLGIFLIIKRKKLLGIFVVFLSVGVLLLSAVMFAEKIYLLEGKERTEVISLAVPMAKEMLNYYNEENYDNFCKYCGISLKTMLEKNPIKHLRDSFGPYLDIGEAEQVFNKGGRFYVVFPVQFRNVKNPMHLTFVMENISSKKPSVYGFSFSENEQ